MSFLVYGFPWLCVGVLAFLLYRKQCQLEFMGQLYDKSNKANRYLMSECETLSAQLERTDRERSYYNRAYLGSENCRKKLYMENISLKNILEEGNDA